MNQEQASLIRCRSPVHIHVDDTTPVHVHVQKKKLEGISVSVHYISQKLLGRHATPILYSVKNFHTCIMK